MGRRDGLANLRRKHGAGVTEFETLQAALAQMPPGMVRLWIDEVLIRGTPEGGIAGSHVVCGVEMTDPMGGKTRVAKGPYPLDVLGGDFAAVLGATLVQQQATIAARDARIAELEADLAARQLTLDKHAETIDVQASAIAELKSQATPVEATE